MGNAAIIGKRSIPLAQIKSNQDIMALKAEGLKAEQKAKDLLLKEQEQKAKDELNKRKTESEIALNEARTTKLGRGKAGKGGGGSRGGTVGMTPEEIAANMNPAEALADRIQKGVMDPDTGAKRPLTQAEKIHAASQLRIPITGKPSETTLKSINDGSVFNANQALKQGALEIKGENQARQDTRLWA